MQGIRLVFSIMLVVAGIVGLPRISAQLCNGNFADIERECQKYYQPEGPMIPPSAACCNTLRNVDVACMCRYSSFFQQYFSGEKVVYVLRSCGRTVPPGTRCGNYSAPPASVLV